MANGEKCNNKDCKIIVTEVRKNGQYKKYCSSSCRRLGVAEKCKSTSLERYGVSNPSKSKIIKDRIKDSFEEKYGEGITNAMHIQSFKDKIVETNVDRYGTAKPQLLEQFRTKTKETNLEKYGVETPQRLKELKDKSKETCNAKYGGAGPQCDSEVRKKSTATCLEKYNVSNPSKLEEIWIKIRETSLRKYGTESPNQDPDIHRKQDGARFRNKKYLFEDGKCIFLQGYEPWAIDILVGLGYKSNELETETKFMPKINYNEGDKIRRYFPDVYISKENLIIEVKSTWTYEKDKIRNLLKRQACLDAGYNFKFMIFDKDGNLLPDQMINN